MSASGYLANGRWEARLARIKQHGLSWLAAARTARNGFPAIDLKRLIVIFSTVAALTVCVLLGGWLRLRYEETLSTAAETAETLAKSAEIHTTRTLLSIDYMLVGLIEGLNDQIGRGETSLEDIDRLFEQTSEQSLQVSDIFLLDENGMRIAGARSAGAPVSYADAPFFTAQQGGSAQSLLVGPPYRSSVTGRWSVIMSRKFASGAIGGVLAAEVPTDAFGEFFRAINSNANFHIVLYRSDSTVLATEPYYEQVIGTRLDSQPLFADGLFAQGEGLYETVNPVTGRWSNAAFRAVPVRPLLITVSFDEAEVLQEWRDNLTLAALLMAAIGSMILLFTIALIRLQQSQRRAEAARSEAEKSYRSIFDNAPIGIFRSTPDGRILRANPVLANMLGYDGEDDLTRDPASRSDNWYVNQDRRAEFWRMLERDGYVTNFQSEVRRTGRGRDERFWVSENAHLVRDDTGKVMFYEGTVEDISERVKADKELNRFHVVVEASQEAIAIAGLDGTLIYANRAHQQLFGHPPLQRRPRHWYDSLSQKGVAEFESDVLPALERSKSWEGVLTAVDSMGREFALWSRTDTIDDENGEPQLVFAMMHDYTSEIEMRNELREARDRAQEANKAKSDFLATMSHELRTPLNAILGFSDIIRSVSVSNKVSPQKLPEYANDIHTSGTQLLEMINDILDISKIEAETLSIAPGMVELRKVVNEAINLLRTRAEEKEIDLTLSLPGGLPAMHGDERALRQICINLLSNAVKFTPPGGKIRIEASGSEDGMLRINVTDTGIGIPEREIPRIMRPFEQADNRYMNAKGGTGLGLPIVKGLVELHGGSIDISSRVGEGTTVSVTLPRIAHAAE